MYLLVFHTYFLLGILIFKGLTAQCLHKSFGIKGLMHGHVKLKQSITGLERP
jgi:hypothetical protein